MLVNLNVIQSITCAQRFHEVPVMPTKTVEKLNATRRMSPVEHEVQHRAHSSLSGPRDEDIITLV